MDPQLYDAVRCGDEFFIWQLQRSDETTLAKVTPQRATVLHVAARFGQTQIAKMILEWHPSLLCQKNSKGDTPLHIAARIGDSDMVHLLVNYKVAELNQEVDEADEKLVQIVNMKEETALHDAVRGGHLEVVKLLIDKNPRLPTLTTDGGESPLFLAVERMHIQVAARILSHAQFFSFQGRNNMNALHAAIIRGCNLGFIKVLLQKMPPSAISETDNSGRTALHHAASLGEQRILEELLSTDNSIGYAKDKEGMTALHIAAKEGRVDIMRKLAQRCRDIWDSVNNKGQTALHVATKIGEAKIVKFILKEVPDDIINLQDNDGNSSLHLAALGGNFEIIELLRADGRVDEMAINNKGVAFMDILLSDYSELSSQEKVIDRRDVRHLASLERVISKRNQQGMLSVNEVEDTKEISKAAERIMIEPEQLQEGSRKPFKHNIPAAKDDEIKAGEASSNIVVATLIVGISFAAAVTVPGGYKSDGPDAGTAILGYRASFRAFALFNSLAFASSFGSVFSHFIISKGRRAEYTKTIRRPILCSVICLLLAFLTGSYTVLPHSRRVSIPVVVSAFCYFVYTVVTTSAGFVYHRLRIIRQINRGLRSTGQIIHRQRIIELIKNPHAGTRNLRQRIKANLRGLWELLKRSG